MIIVKSETLIIPVLLYKYKQILKDFEQETGHTLSIVETYRSPERQAKLYEQGRTTSGQVVTGTKESFHTLGLALDICGDINPSKKGRQDPYNIDWPKLGSIVIRHGCTWGGNWGDSCHIELTANYTKGQINEMIQKHGLLYVWQRIQSYYAHR